jgi:prepilin-type N-terminal cleavage/methylation domain-containing protein
MQKNFLKKGFTLIELLISVAIISLLTVTVSTFQKDVFFLNFSLQGSLNAQLDARHIVKVIITELRETGPSALGAYPIAVANPTNITFYSDIDNDGLKDRVRYFLSGTDLRRGIVSPSGSPLTYNDVNEKLSTLVSGYIASTTNPLFQYYPASYDGTTAPLSQPVNIQSIRLIKVTAIINKDPNRNPAPIIVTSQVNLRNLKDNQ